MSPWYKLVHCKSDSDLTKIAETNSTKMTSSESPLIRDVEHNYGSVAPTSALSQRDEAISNDSNRPKVPGFTTRNTGMLLVISAHFFFTCMNISVKMLNRLDHPVHALEVGYFCLRYLNDLISESV